MMPPLSALLPRLRACGVDSAAFALADRTCTVASRDELRALAVTLGWLDVAKVLSRPLPRGRHYVAMFCGASHHIVELGEAEVDVLDDADVRARVERGELRKLAGETHVDLDAVARLRGAMARRGRRKK